MENAMNFLRGCLYFSQAFRIMKSEGGRWEGIGDLVSLVSFLYFMPDFSK